MENQINRKHLSWDVIKSASSSVATALKNDKIDIIVALGRGGMIPARLVSEYLNVHDVRVIPCYSYDGINKRGELFVNEKALNFSDFEGKTVLLIDDVYTSGQTIKLIKNLFFNKVSTINIITATLYFNVQCLKKYAKKVEGLNGDKLTDTIRDLTGLDIYGHMYLASQDWLVFPWEFD